MEEISRVNKMKHGIYYTPSDLAEYLVDSILKEDDVTVFDPSYGAGALLSAASKIRESHDNNKELNLFGCDIHKSIVTDNSLSNAFLIETDFFEFNPETRFDLILTNPPYVKHQNQDKKHIAELKKLYPELKILSNSSDLWAYFLVKCTGHLKINGSIGAILPWSFIQSNYSIQVRKWLLENFGDIKLLALNNAYFEGANERVVLLWLKEYGTKNSSIQFACTNEPEEKIFYTHLSKNEWLENIIMHNRSVKLNTIFDYLKQSPNFSQFEEYAEVRIGVVTGANKFFIQKKEEALNLGFKKKDLVPIITKSNELVSFLKTGRKSLKQLLHIDRSWENSEYLKHGISEEYHLRTHSKNRSIWYQIPSSKLPDAFFPYRVGKIPFMVLNNNKVQSTNSIHRIYFKNVTPIEQKSIVISLLSIYGQLSIETNAKTYGRGMIKIEPGSLYKILVSKLDVHGVHDIYEKIIQFLINDQKEEAVLIATDFLNKELNIANEISELANLIWEEINNKRVK